MRFYRLLAPLGVLTLFTLLLTQPVHAASVTYSYVGNLLNSNTAGTGAPPTPFSGRGSISGQFTINCAGIGNGDCANLPFAEYGSRITDYSFAYTDVANAAYTLTFANRNSQQSVRISTDANRNLTFWNLILSALTPNCPPGASFCGLGVRGGAGLTLPPWDSAVLFVGTATPEATSVASGTFSITATSVPLPIPLVMLLGGIASVMPLVRRRR